MLKYGLLRSMAVEARLNEGGKWWAEFEYVVERPSEGGEIAGIARAGFNVDVYV